MTDKHLPIFEIQDFDDAHREEYFYISPLRRHLQKHLFIQKPHKHNFYILLFITQGTGTHIIDFQEHPVKPNTVFFLTPGQVHSWQLSDDTEGYILFFTTGFYLLNNSFQKLHQFPFFYAALRSPTIVLSDQELDPLLQTIELLKTEQNQNMLMKDDMLRDNLDILLIKLTRTYLHYHPQQPEFSPNFSLLQNLETLINAYYKEHQPVSFYAEKLHITPKQLNDATKRALGKTTTELIQDRIILEAKRLLVHSPMTIAQVAAELGYFDNAYFFRFFKKNTGQTPQQFRNTHL